ncbi:protein kinase domain-containing protein [Kitasatospora cineracea]|uniref:protein kinase domain-containing protein n=1 Tax=Kitasatospora cineracea TaxID=88074 RepID=UPI003693F3C3
MQHIPHDERAGLIGGRYALREVIGRGGMGEVWSADDLLLHRTVAVKLMHPQLALDDVAQSRFQREVRAAASLNHPCIAAVHDTGWLPTAPPRPFLVMEHVPGHTAAERLRSHPPTLQEALAWTAGTLDALACAHAAGLVHRDIKPANVMITTDGLVKVMDFGVARVRDGHEESVTGTGNAVGTTAYMSPEQAQGLPVDARSDLYSTGCMLYELLTGRQPFTGDSPFAVAYQHIRADPPTPADLGVDLPAHVGAALARAMAKNPDDRFADAEAMRSALLAPADHDFPPSRAGAPAPAGREQATAVLTPSGRLRASRRTVLAGLALLGAGAAAAAVMAAVPDAAHTTGPTARSSPSPTGAPSSPEPSAGAPGSARPGRSAGPTSPRPTAEPTTATVAVPGDLVGKSLAQAEAELAELGLNPSLAPGSGDAGTVLATAPSAGTQVSRGSTVLLTTRADAPTSAPARATPTGATASPAPSPSASRTSAAPGPVLPPLPVHH